MTSSENEFFAMVQVNRLWATLMGRGLVEPIDDMRATNPPSNPELLAYLESAEINYLDYSNILDKDDEGFLFGDGHPTAKAHKIVAEKLIQDLQLQDE